MLPTAEIVTDLQKEQATHFEGWFTKELRLSTLTLLYIFTLIMQTCEKFISVHFEAQSHADAFHMNR